MKNLFITLLILVTPAIVCAKTATVTYTYNGAVTDTVAIVISETPNFTETLINGDTVVGAMDIDSDGLVQIYNLVPGYTYYVSAVAWDTNNIISDFCEEQELVVQAQAPFTIIEYPPIEIEDGKTITFSVTVE